MSALAAGALVAEAARALGLEQPDVAVLEGGVANRTLRLREGARDLVLRLAGPSARGLGADPRAEFAMQSLAAGAGLAPQVVLADPAGRFLVTRFVAGRTPGAGDLRDPAFLARLGVWCARLHALAPPAGLAPVDFGARAAACLERAAGGGADDVVPALQRGLARRRAALPPAARLAPCHHDLHRRNLREDGACLLAVDWEYAGPGDPAADLAACAGYHALGAEPLAGLLDGYGADAELRARVAALAWIFDCLWYAWNAAAGLAGHPVDAAQQSRIAARLLV